MDSHHTFEDGLKYKPDYSWPEKGSKRDCPKCNNSLELLENKENYYGKPWWCAPCQWQYSEEDFKSSLKDSTE
ncbi:MAG: hypothetical protein CMG74_08420 [Candidatus Marinimicrobia bacterium]|nr:hypothetical protein [Candidatus Neomarinimicrobiota bacterium]|tara:strand:+ start:19405 stop:19623 length:219 start_codon:yes stop_codon:yes gene_type:complete